MKSPRNPGSRRLKWKSSNQFILNECITSRYNYKYGMSEQIKPRSYSNILHPNIVLYCTICIRLYMSNCIYKGQCISNVSGFIRLDMKENQILLITEKTIFMALFMHFHNENLVTRN